MLAKRIIPCLDIKDGQTVKGINFENLRQAGDPIELAKYYVQQGADELVFLDITATLDRRKTFKELVSKIAREINIPFTVGGGISTLADVQDLLQAGADKISINSSAVSNPELISKLASEVGSQCVVVAVDTKFNGSSWNVFVKSGTIDTGLDTLTWIKKVESLGAGEILLTSMNSDGTKEGFALDITSQVSKAVKIPVIASGGAGCPQDFIDVFTKGLADAALAASVFHFGEIKIPDLKRILKDNNIEVRL